MTKMKKKVSEKFLRTIFRRLPSWAPFYGAVLRMLEDIDGERIDALLDS